MDERINFALEPGVIILAALFLVAINVLLAAVLYPYFRSSSDAEVAEPADDALEPEGGTDPVSTDDPEEFNQRVDEFLEDVRSEKVE
ncbi:MAG: hypothetical protein BRD55_11510 [Bacteroidetes bacterium SW_9_63_38]|nr:MAG: hypothetical protein BRD55_11510 [Bacteroidetes bacterium SW_9_63_38]